MHRSRSNFRVSCSESEGTGEFFPHNHWRHEAHRKWSEKCWQVLSTESDFTSCAEGNEYSGWQKCIYTAYFRILDCDVLITVVHTSSLTTTRSPILALHTRVGVILRGGCLLKCAKSPLGIAWCWWEASLWPWCVSSRAFPHFAH